jgi:pilus assembly protein Flp/PilA
MKIALFFRRFLNEEDGPTAVEYAAMLALVLIAVIGAVNSVGNATSAKWQNNANSISTAVTSAIAS